MNRNEPSRTKHRIMNYTAIRRLAVLWAGFLTALTVLGWMHTFQDRLSHEAIGPLFLLLWIFQLAFVWDGCKTLRPGLRHFLFLLQVALSLAVCLAFFQYLISQSV